MTDPISIYPLFLAQQTYPPSIVATADSAFGVDVVPIVQVALVTPAIRVELADEYGVSIAAPLEVELGDGELGASVGSTQTVEIQ